MRESKSKHRIRNKTRKNTVLRFLVKNDVNFLCGLDSGHIFIIFP